jgi:ribosomal protein S17
MTTYCKCRPGIACKLKTINFSGKPIKVQIESFKMTQTLKAKEEITTYIPKYEGYLKKKLTRLVHVPHCQNVGDAKTCLILKTTPISKKVNYILIATC